LHHKIHRRFWYGSASGSASESFSESQRYIRLRIHDQDCLCDMYCREEADWITGDPEPDGSGQEGAFHPRLGISHHCSRSASFQLKIFGRLFIG
jgi:hypothetical protein